MTAPRSRLSWMPAAMLALASALASEQPPHARAQPPGPELTIVEPDPHSPLLGIVGMSADVVPVAGVVSVEFQVNGAPACTALPPPPFSCVWEADDSPEAIVVRAVARLADGGRVVRSVRARGRPRTLFAAGTSMVLVPVVVQDRSGRFVTGLTEGDFTLFEDGVLQAPTLLDEASALPRLSAGDPPPALAPALRVRLVAGGGFGAAGAAAVRQDALRHQRLVAGAV